MNIVEIVVKTIITTVDVLLTIAVMKTPETDNKMLKAFLVLIIMNLMGVWI